MTAAVHFLTLNYWGRVPNVSWGTDANAIANDIVQMSS